MDIGQKLREFGISKYGSIKEFARALDIQPPSLQRYLKGDQLPGGTFLSKLLNLGCDINWLLSARESSIKNNADNLNLGNRIKAIRKGLGINQETFAELIGVKTKTAISNWEQGKCEPNISKLLTIAKAGGKSIDWLTNGTDNVKIKSEALLLLNSELETLIELKTLLCNRIRKIECQIKLQEKVDEL